MRKRLSFLAPGNSSKKENPQKEDKETTINPVHTIQAQIVSAIKNREPIENIKSLLKPYLPKDTLVILAAQNIIHTNRPITEVKEILKLSVSPNNLVIDSAIKYAEKHNRTEEDIMILKSYKSEFESCPEKKRIEFFNTFLKEVAQDGDIKELKRILNLKEEIDINSEESPLMLAAQNGHVEAVKLLLEHGASINVQGWGEGKSSLLNDVSAQASILFKAWKEIGSVEVPLQNQGKDAKANLYPVFNTTVSSKYNEYREMREMSEKDISNLIIKLLQRLEDDHKAFTEIKNLLEYYAGQEKTKLENILDQHDEGYISDSNIEISKPTKKGSKLGEVSSKSGIFRTFSREGLDKLEQYHTSLSGETDLFESEFFSSES